MRLPRVAIIGLWHETNTYSVRRATIASFQEFELFAGASVAEHHAGTRSVIAGFLDAPGLDTVPVFSAGAWPCGPVEKETLDELHRRLTDQLSEVARAGTIDGVLINFHGAMVSEDCADVEAATIRLIREVVGRVPTAAVLDLHANPSTDFVGMCDVVLSYDTYPHVDMWERGNEAAHLLKEVIDGRPLVTVVAKVPLLTCPLAQGTSDEPMRALQARAASRAAEAGIVRVCITAGFPFSDVERAGVSVLAVTDTHRVSDARRVANETAADIEESADLFAVVRDSPSVAVGRAMARTDRPVVLADVADNIGAGSPGDGTALLKELLDQAAPDAVVVIADAEVVRLAVQAGQGGVVETALGAKADSLHGVPVPIRGEVLTISDGTYTSGGTWMTGQTFRMGTTVVLRHEGLRIVVTERATPPFHREQLLVVGIDPSDVAIIVAKGALAWKAAYPEATNPIEVNTPGICPIDPTDLPRSNEPVRALA